MQVRSMIVIDVLLPAHHGSWFLAIEKLFPWRQALICLLLICCDLKMKKMIFFFVTRIFQSSQLKFFLLTQSNLNDSWGVWVWDGMGCRTRCEKAEADTTYEHDLSSTDILNHVTSHRLKGSWGKIFWKLRWIPWNHMWSLRCRLKTTHWLAF